MKQTIFFALAIVSMVACNKSDDKVTYIVDDARSKAEWKGSAPDHFHTGSFDVKGTISADPGGKSYEGGFTIPIASIKNFDLPDPVNTELLNHLKSQDFFNMVVHPNATFRITSVKPYTGSGNNSIPGANFLVTGQFSLIGQTHELSFPAKMIANTDSLFADASFSFSRLKWGMNSYNNPSEGLYILPDINIDLHISAGKQK